MSLSAVSALALLGPLAPDGVCVVASAVGACTEIDHGGTTSDWLRICRGLIYSVEIARAGGEDGGYGQCCEDFLVHGSDSFGVDVLV